LPLSGERDYKEEAKGIALYTTPRRALKEPREGERRKHGMGGRTRFKAQKLLTIPWKGPFPFSLHFTLHFQRASR